MDVIAIPGARDIRATLDGDREADAVVVACPPHPQHGGSRSDPRLLAVSEALVGRDVACLRFDYGPWDEGRGEQRDAADVLNWADDRFELVGLFGYSFGAGVALRVAAGEDPEPAAVSALAAPADAADALDAIPCPVQIVYGERDDTVDWEPVVSRARALGQSIECLPADHHFVGQTDRIATAVTEFLCQPGQY